MCPPDLASFKADVAGAVNRMTVGLDRVTVVFVSCNAGSAGDPAPSSNWTESSGGNGCATSGSANGSAGDLVSVRLEYTYRPITPVISSLIGAIPLSGSTTMVVN